MSSEEPDLTPEQLGSVQEALGVQLKLCAVQNVKLELRGERLESRILALAPHRMFLLSTRAPVKLDQSFSVFDLQSISSMRQKQVLLESDRCQVSLRFSSDQDVDELIALIGINIQEIYPELDPMRVIKKLTLKPVERQTTLQQLWENHSPAEAGPCGGFSRQYWCVCDQLNIPYREEVQWDVDTIYLSQDSRELCLQDFIHLDNRDLMAITAALEFNQWFIKLSVKDFKLGADLSDQILKVASRSTQLEQLVLDNTGLKCDFALRFAAALSQNPNSALHTVIFPNNCLEDKGVVALSSMFSKLKHLDLSKNSLSAKGVNLLAQSFCTNTLTHLQLSGNTMRGEDMTNLWSFLSQHNTLHTLDMSGCECSLEQVCSSLSRGSLKHLTVLNMSRSVFSYKRGREVSSSVKKFFSTALSLRSICLSATKLPGEGLKAILVGLACNSHLRDVSLDISGCELRSSGSQILEGCVAEIPNITSLDISDNGLDADLSTLLVWLRKNRSIKHLFIGKNFSNIRAKNLGQVLVSLVHLIQDEECPLASLSVADSRLKADLSVLLSAVGSNHSLTHLDISGNNMGDFGAKMLSKALQINTKLSTLVWDRNGVSAQGLQDVASALEKNYTIRFMPVPIMDAAQALKNNPEKTEEALLKMEQYLLRNHESRRYLQDQAFRLQQGLITSTTQPVMAQVCVQVQDQLNSLRFSTSQKVQQDIKDTDSLMRDARSSTSLLRSLYHQDGATSVCVQQVQEKLSSVAGEISAEIDLQLQGLLVSMVNTAQSVCPHIIQDVREDLLRVSEGRMSVSRAFITASLLEHSAIDIINKISEVKLSMASCLSDHITDQILQSLSRSQKTLAGHLSRRGQHSLIRHDSRDPEDLEERESQSQNLSPAEPEPEPQTQKVKRKTIHSRMFRPMSSALELGFDVWKAIDDISIHLEDLPPPPPLSPLALLTPPPLPSTSPVEAELELPVGFSNLPVNTPSLQHITKLRPRRTKKSKPSRGTAQPVRRDAAPDETSCVPDQLDEGVPEFYSRKVTTINTKSSVNDGEKKRESRLSGFFSLIKHRSSTKATPTSPAPPAITEVSVPHHEVTVTPGELPEPAPDHVAPEVKGHGGVKHETPPMTRPSLSADLLAEIRAKQEKRKKEKASVPPNWAAEIPEEGRVRIIGDFPGSGNLLHAPEEHTLKPAPDHTDQSEQIFRSPTTLSESRAHSHTHSLTDSALESSAAPLLLTEDIEGAELSPANQTPPITSFTRSVSCTQTSTGPEEGNVELQRTRSVPSAHMTSN